jgi:hypothetical protein
MKNTKKAVQKSGTIKKNLSKSKSVKSEKDYEGCNPSDVTEIYWLTAFRKVGKYPSSTKNSGKWLIFEDIQMIDKIWEKIKIATEKGMLGEASKVATAKENPNATDRNSKVICVYSYDYTDKDDVMRIRQVLRDLGIIKKIPYKTDDATVKRQYQVKGNTRISVYYE